MAERIFIFGCGGHSKVVRDIIDADARFRTAGYVDTNVDHVEHNELPLYEEEHFFENFELEYVIVAVGDNGIRKKVFTKLKERGFYMPSIVHPSAILSRNVELSAGNIIMPNAVINASSTVGDGCVINTSSVVEHDCVVEDFVSVSPKAVVCGNCHLKEGAYIGANASVIQSLTISEWSVVASQSAVIENVPPYTLVAGVPASTKKKLEAGHTVP